MSPAVSNYFLLTYQQNKQRAKSETWKQTRANMRARSGGGRKAETVRVHLANLTRDRRSSDGAHTKTQVRQCSGPRAMLLVQPFALRGQAPPPARGTRRLDLVERWMGGWAEVYGDVGRCWETQGASSGTRSRRGRSWGDIWRCREMPGDVKRCGEI